MKAHRDSDDPETMRYDKEIAKNVPMMFHFLFGIWTFMCLIAIILINRPEKAGKVRKKQTDLFESGYMSSMHSTASNLD